MALVRDRFLALSMRTRSSTPSPSRKADLTGCTAGASAEKGVGVGDERAEHRASKQFSMNSTSSLEAGSRLRYTCGRHKDEESAQRLHLIKSE